MVIIPDEPREKLLCGCSAVSAISRTLCEAGSQLTEKPLYCHVASLKYGQVCQKHGGSVSFTGGYVMGRVGQFLLQPGTSGVE